ncbi:MAG TPA: hypothetical protein VIY48_13840 [Candidatus Paceibacterota bacterium]
MDQILYYILTPSGIHGSGAYDTLSAALTVVRNHNNAITSPQTLESDGWIVVPGVI